MLLYTPPDPPAYTVEVWSGLSITKAGEKLDEPIVTFVQSPPLLVLLYKYVSVAYSVVGSAGSITSERALMELILVQVIVPADAESLCPIPSKIRTKQKRIHKQALFWRIDYPPFIAGLS